MRVALAPEAGALLAALHPEDRLPYAIAFDAGLRRSELYRLEWPDVLDGDRIASRILVMKSKSDAGTHRRPPIADNLRTILAAAWERQGHPREGKVLDRSVMSAAIRAAEDKATQLSAAARLGFRVPSTAWTNDAATAERAAAAGSVVAKPVTSAAWDDDDGPSFVFAQLVGQDELPGDDELALLPVAFQRPIWPKRDVRVTVIGSRVLAAVAEPDQDALDWRLSPNRSWSPYTLRAEDADRCAALVARLGLRFAGIDLAIDKADDAWFLEANPNGEWGWLAQGDAALPIVEALADELTLRDV
ncbi:MAG: hypothetical protein ACRDK0_13610 [Solirubrobacteraceae bacterium]